MDKNIWGVARHGKDFGKKKQVVETGLKCIIHVSVTTVSFFSKHKKCKCLTASCLVYVYNV